MLLPFKGKDVLYVTNQYDPECAALADRHYSRRTLGGRQFAYAGKKLILRNAEGSALLVWIHPRPEYRQDGRRGYYLQIFRNESKRRASEILLEAERIVFERWGPNHLFTFVDPRKTRAIFRHGRRVVGFCFLKAGWKPMRNQDGTPCLTKRGLWVFTKGWR